MAYASLPPVGKDEGGSASQQHRTSPSTWHGAAQEHLLLQFGLESARLLVVLPSSHHGEVKAQVRILLTVFLIGRTKAACPLSLINVLHFQKNTKLVLSSQTRLIFL